MHIRENCDRLWSTWTLEVGKHSDLVTDFVLQFLSEENQEKLKYEYVSERRAVVLTVAGSVVFFLFQRVMIASYSFTPFQANGRALLAGTPFFVVAADHWIEHLKVCYSEQDTLGKIGTVINILLVASLCWVTYRNFPASFSTVSLLDCLGLVLWCDSALAATVIMNATLLDIRRTSKNAKNPVNEWAETRCGQLEEEIKRLKAEIQMLLTTWQAHSDLRASCAPLLCEFNRNIQRYRETPRGRPYNPEDPLDRWALLELEKGKLQFQLMEAKIILKEHPQQKALFDRYLTQDNLPLLRSDGSSPR